MAVDIFKRYIWILTTISRYNKISIKDLKQLYESNEQISGGEKFNERTFHRHREKIYEIFSVEILCDKNLYYIADIDNIRKGSMQSWLINTIATHNVISENQNLKDRILIENYLNTEKFLPTIIYAMKDGVCLRLKYHKFDSVSDEQVIIEPYCVKTFHNRLYLLASKEGNQLRTYALDRIISLQRTDKKFVYPNDFSPEEYFMGFYGVFTDKSIEQKTIELKVYGKDVNYLRTLPLHFTQKEIKTCKNYSVFSLYLSPTYDFIQEILSFNSAIEVLKPQSLRNEIIKLLQENLNRYIK